MANRDKTMSARALLRLYLRLREGGDGGRIEAGLQLLQNRDVDLSIRLGSLLAFDALLLGAAIQPIVASPGAPLSLDAAKDPLETIVSLIGVACFAAAGLLAVNAITIGEEISDEGIEGDHEALGQRLLAAYCTSIDRQRRDLGHAIRLTIAGLVVTAAVFGWVIGLKIIG